MLKREIVVPPPHLYPPDPWRIVEARWTPEFAPRAETALALSNGYLGVRGTLEEGRPTSSPGVYVNGFHETWPIFHAEDAFGLARVGQTIVNVPDASIIELYVDDEPLFLPTARMPEYARVLDLRRGTLSRELVWSTPSGKHVRVRSRRLVSFEHRHVMAMSYEVSVDEPAPVVLRSLVVNRANRPASQVPPVAPGHRDGPGDPRLGSHLDRPILEPVLAEGTAGHLVLGYRTVQSGMALAVGVQHVLDVADRHHQTQVADPERSSFEVAVDAAPGVPIRLRKYVAYQTSRTAPAAELADRCRRTLRRVTAGGFESLESSQRHQLDLFWDRADVTLTDTVRDATRMQQAVRWNIFQLGQATWRAEGGGVPAKGLTGNAYDGHYFWDTETWVLPFLDYTQPRITRNLLRFRHSMLAQARERAAMLDLRGALFPWRTINGFEASAQFQAGTAQYHINADIASAIRRYVDVRGDVGFLVEVGAEILVETARLWADLGFYGEDGCFHVHGVTGPDEYTAVVDDNAYTNLMARANLRDAVGALRRLAAERPESHRSLCEDLRIGPEEPAEWQRAAEHMYIPHDPARGITPQDATFLSHERWDLDRTPASDFPLLLHYHPLVIYRRQVLKQADVVMAMFLLGDEFSMEQKRRNFHYYDPITTGDSTLSASIQSIVASQIDEPDAAARYFDFALLVDLADVAGNMPDGIHVASAAGAWMALVFGFGGVTDVGGRLRFDPRLPPRFACLSFSLRFRDRQLRVRLDHTSERFVLDEGDPLDIEVRGGTHRLELHHPLELPRRGLADPA